MNNRNHLQANQELFIISLTFFITVVVWIVVEIYHIRKGEEFEVQYQTSLQTVIHPIDQKKVESVTKEH